LGLIEEIDNPVVVWVSRTAALEAIAARLDKAGIPNVVYSGAQNKEEKDEAERKMKSGEARVFIANPASASFGLNSLKDVNYCVWYSINDSVEQYHQAQHRILRGESKFPKFAYNLYMEGTVEKKHRDALKLGLELITGKTDKNKFVREA
jgi:SNF2 family DNA or RNA helicase